MGPGHARAFVTATAGPSSIVGEASHPGPAPPAADSAGAPAPGEVLRYMRPIARAVPGTSRGGGHRQSKGKARGAGHRGRSSGIAYGWADGPGRRFPPGRGWW